MENPNSELWGVTYHKIIIRVIKMQNNTLSNTVRTLRNCVLNLLLISVIIGSGYYVRVYFVETPIIIFSLYHI